MPVRSLQVLSAVQAAKQLTLKDDHSVHMQMHRVSLFWQLEPDVSADQLLELMPGTFWLHVAHREIFPCTNARKSHLEQECQKAGIPFPDRYLDRSANMLVEDFEILACLSLQHPAPESQSTSIMLMG